MKTAHTGREPELTISGLWRSPPTCHRLEYLDHAGAILAEPVNVVDGLAYPPDRPGAGLQWNEAEVRRWAVS